VLLHLVATLDIPVRATRAIRRISRGARNGDMFVAMKTRLSPGASAAARRVALIATLMVAVGCASSGSNDLHDLVSRTPITRTLVSTGGHVPAINVVARDRDELLGVLDSIHTHYAAREARTTRISRWLVVTEIVDLLLGAISPALTKEPDKRLAISEVSAGIALALSGLQAKLDLGRKSEVLRGCISTLYHGATDIRIRYSNATLPQTDSAWTHYIYFKDSLDRAIRVGCS
jgi:hypothetical protein